MRARVARIPAFVRRVGSLSLGTVTGQALLLLASPFVTRLYSPEEFGTFSAALGVATLLATLCSLSLQSAIPSASTDEEAGDLLWASLLAGVLLAPVAIVVAAMASTRFGGTTFSVGLWGATAATAMLISTWGSIRALASRHDRFRSVSVSSVADSGIQAGGQLTLGQFHTGAFGLSLGYLSGKLASIATLLWGLPIHHLRPRLPFAAMRRWKRYVLLLTPTSLLNQAAVTSVSVFIAVLYGAGRAGQFALASRMLAVPSALLGQAVATVFLPKIAKMTRGQTSTAPAVLAVATTLSTVSWPIFAVTTLLGPEIFTITFGAAWRDAGVAAAILSPWLALNLVSSPISSVMMVRDRLRQLLVLGIVEASLRFGSLAAGHGTQNWQLSLVLYSASGVAISLFAIAFVLRLSGASIGDWIRSIPWHLRTFLAAVTLLAMAKPLVPATPFVVASCLTCTVGIATAGRSLLTQLKN